MREYYRSRKGIWFWLIAGLFVYTALAPTGGCTKYGRLATGYRALALVRDAGNTGTKTVAEWLRYQGKKCLELHKSRSAPAYATCINPERAKAQTWRTAMVGLNVALAAALAALRAYHAYLDGKAGGKKVSWIKVLRPVVCGMAKAVRALRESVPKLGEAEKILAIVEGVTCGQ